MRIPSGTSIPSLAWFLAFFLTLSIPASAASLEANKAVVRQFLEEVLSTGKFDKLDTLVSPAYVDRHAEAALRGPAVVRRAQEQARALFPELRYEIAELIAEGDRVVARYTIKGVYKPKDRKDSGEPIEVAGITAFRVADGQIQEAWIINDQIKLFRQLGYTLQPPLSSGTSPR